MNRLSTEGARSLNRHLFSLILALFGSFGITFGTWLVLLGELQAAFFLSPAMLGAVLTSGLLASLIVMPLSGRSVDRWGVGRVTAVAIGIVGVTLLSTSVVHDRWLLVPLFLLFYSSTAAYDVGINAAAISFEQTSGRQAMSYFHAAFSGFAALTALVIGSLMAVGISFRFLYFGAVLLATVLGIAIWRSRPLWVTADVSPPRPRERRAAGLYRSPTILLLAVIAALAFLVEGEMGNWAAIYLRSSLELPALVGASGFAVFHAAMLVGRLLGAPAIKRLGRRSVLRIAGVTVAAGMLVALSSEQAAFVLAGFLLVGLALSVVAPTVYSLAGDAAAERAGEVSSVLTTIGYSGYLIGPVLVGGIAEVAGLRPALATIVLAGGGIALLSSVMRPRTPAQEANAANAPMFDQAAESFPNSDL